MVVPSLISLNPSQMATSSNEVYAAIALALHEFKGNNVHDVETGIITIREHHTEWNAHLPMTTMHP